MRDRWWLREHPITFTWDIWYACNYRCSYCWWEMDKLWDKLALQNRLLPPEAWGRIWDRLGDLYGPLRLDIIGGEPLLYPRFDEVLGVLAARHFVQITTNLSLARPRLERVLQAAAPDRVHFNASFHPEFAPVEAFLDSLRLLRERGFEPGVLFVTWPAFLDRLAEFRRRFQEEGHPFSLMIFQGRWQGKTYPEAYTGPEKALISEMMNHPVFKDAEVKYRLERQSTLGKLCHSGRVYANVKGNGDVFRCGQDAFGQSPMGNLFDPDFKLHDAPQPCPYGTCSCLEFKFLDEIMSRPEVAA